MDISREENRYESFLKYQRSIAREFRRMETLYSFETINCNRTPRAIFSDLQIRIRGILESSIPEEARADSLS